jgi:MAF protein
MDAEVNESPQHGESPLELALRLSLAKAQAISARVGAREVVLAADTVVALDERILGKPRDDDEAGQMLRVLRGGIHRVITGIAILSPSQPPMVQGVETSVWMRDYSEREIGSFIDSGEALDKAGAYAVQDQSFQPVARLEGCYLSVVGLPLCHVHNALLALGIICGRHPTDVCARAFMDGCPLATEPVENRPQYTIQA